MGETKELSDTQLQTLRWIDVFPSTSAAWTVDGAPIKRQPFEKWNLMEIKGKRGSILVHKDDLKAIGPFIQHLTHPDKLYALNEAGRAAVTSRAASQDLAHGEASGQVDDR